MLQSSDDAPRVLAAGQSLLGPGWKAVDSFDDLSDPGDFESSEEVGRFTKATNMLKSRTGDVCGDGSWSSSRQSCSSDRDAVSAHRVTSSSDLPDDIDEIL